MVSLISFGDESGTHDETGVRFGAEVAGVFGYLATKEQWDEFTVTWSSILDEFNILVFHMSEFADRINGPRNPNWPYLLWSEEKRSRFIGRLIATARDYTSFAVGGLVKVEAYHRMTPAEIKVAMEHPYHFCFQSFLDQLLPMLELFEPPMEDGDKVDFFFDQQDEMEIRARQTFSVVRILRDPRARLGALTFASKTEYIPLQAADLLAYIMRQAASRKLSGDMEIKPDGWEAQLISRQNVVMGYIKDEGIEQALKGIGAL